MVKTVLITGGSSGIGFELSKLYAADAYHILWVSLSEDELQSAKAKLKKETPHCHIDMLALDLSREGSAQQVLTWTDSNNWELDLLINNAGFAVYGSFENQSTDQVLDMLNLNVKTVYLLTKLYYERMLKRNAGGIINIASSASYHPMPNLSVYSATKSFVRQMTESLYLDNKYRGTNIQIMVVCPGPVADTAFQKSAGMEKVRTFASGIATTNPVEVARDTYKGYKAQKRTVLTGWRYRFTHWITKITPRRVNQFMIKREMNAKSRLPENNQAVMAWKKRVTK